MTKNKFIAQLSITFIPSCLVLGMVFIAKVTFQIPPSLLLRDIAAISGINPLSGVVSSIGIFFWWATATVCLFSAFTLQQFKSKRIFFFLLYSGVFSGFLAFDDFFMFHESLAPRYFKTSEIYILLVLVIAFVVYLFKFHKLILGSDYQFFLISIIFFGISVALDIAYPKWIDMDIEWQILYEDGFKWLGITSWLSYFCYYSYGLFLNGLSRDR
ncbi:hypothetical protein [Pseudanabaena mucicola]|uniref:DUF998 domain-containing protein n=1 Tax=Pseudanabaena mucicola FACHB-723 TaxID=2692860 RepID=A0ABR7ZUC9_9CYAN|nr:hypothetical protein [Pseudanabaena mucicola]MBD2187119.1 hypothetical protein [Pseudanabaena mucicola FACHB-723]